MTVLDQAVSFVAGGGMRIYLRTPPKQQQQWIQLSVESDLPTKEQIEDSSLSQVVCPHAPASSTSL